MVSKKAAGLLWSSTVVFIMLYSGAACDRFRSSRADGEGREAAKFTLPDLSGRTVSLSDFAGEVVLVNFWAAWCVPCVAELPALQRLHEKYKDKGLRIVAINTDTRDNRPRVERVVASLGLSFHVLLDPDISVAPEYGVSGFPESFFVGPDGLLLAINDEATGSRQVRIVSDRPWDSPDYEREVGALLDVKGRRTRS